MIDKINESFMKGVADMAEKLIAQKDAEIERLRAELEKAKEQRGTLAFSSKEGWTPLGEQVRELDLENNRLRAELSECRKGAESVRKHAARLVAWWDTQPMTWYVESNVPKYVHAAMTKLRAIREQPCK